MLVRVLGRSAIAAVVAAATAGCSNALQVVDPGNGRDALVDGFVIEEPGDRLVIDVRFTRPVDVESVVVGRTLVLSTEKDGNARAELTWSPDATEARLRTQLGIRDLFVLDPEGRFRITLVGTDRGEGAILDARGRSLDGDKDGHPGGDHRIQFRMHRNDLLREARTGTDRRPIRHLADGARAGGTLP